MSDNQKQRGDENLDAPAGLAAAFKQLPREPLFIPPTLDEAVLRAARERLEGGMERRPGWIRFFPWFASAAACALLAGGLALYRGVFTGEARHGVVFAREDINHDGRVDILDAFALAKQVRAEHSGAMLDLNRDGAADERDVALIAAHAVKLDKGGS